MLPSADTYHRTRDSTVLLRSGLNLIQQALSIYGEDLRLVFVNQRFRAMFDLPDPLCTPGATFEDTIRYLAQAGEYGPVDDIETYVTERVDQALTFEQHYVERKRANGRWISVEGGPLRQGGWVTVYTDITDIKRQEEVLRARSDELSGRLLDRSEELARANRALEATISRLHETQQHLEAAEARVRLAAETTPAHIARLDLEERYTYSNLRLPVTASNGVEDPVGHSAKDVLGPNVYAKIAPALHSAKEGQAKVVEFRVPEDGRQVQVTFTPDTDATKRVTGVYVLSMDITVPDAVPPAEMPTQSQQARFGHWTVRFDRFELQHHHRKDTPQLAMAEAELLRLFLTRPNQLLTRDDILASPGIPAGSDRALDIRISRLRQKLEDDAKSPTLIRTVYGGGYLFVGDVEWQ